MHDEDLTNMVEFSVPSGYSVSVVPRIQVSSDRISFTVRDDHPLDLSHSPTIGVSRPQ